MLEIPEFLLNEHYDDRYFDVIDALEEAMHIHIGGGNIKERLRDGFKIGETGFGAGRLLVATMETLASANINNATVNYYSCELHPITASRMSHILDSFRYRAKVHIDALVNAYSQLDITAGGWHRLRIGVNDNAIELRLFIGEALAMVESMDALCDAWFLDGHAPAKNPDIWRAELLFAIGKKTAPLGTVTTYTVAGNVRKNLTAAGFTVEKVAGHGRKREALSGQRER